MASLATLRTLFRSVAGNHTPEQLVIQMTDRCNASCPQCGMRTTNRFERNTLGVDETKRIIDAAAQRGVSVLSFTGGEPLLCLDELVELIHYAGAAGIGMIRTGTNGFLFRDSDAPDFTDRAARVADALAGSPLRNFWISLDSAVPAVHEQMRGFPGVVRGIEKALPFFQERGLYPTINLGINRNIGGDAGTLHEAGDDSAVWLDRFQAAFEDGYRRFYRLALDLGFTIVNVCYPMSLDAPESEAGLNGVYAATSADRIVRFSAAEKSRLFQALLNVLPEYRHAIRLFTPRAALHALVRQYTGPANRAYPCRGGIDFFFVDSTDGNTYPCGYRGNENLGKFWDLAGKEQPPPGECLRCDWECFRDPSEMLGPVLEAFQAPMRFAGRWREDPTYFRLWWDDWRYYGACHFFDGRKPPDWKALGRYAPQANRAAEQPATRASSATPH